MRPNWPIRPPSRARRWLAIGLNALRRSALNSTVARAIAYALLLGSGIGAVLYRPLVMRHTFGAPGTIAIGAMVAGAAAVCLVAQFTREVMWERAALFPLGIGLLLYGWIAIEMALSQWPGRSVEAGITLALSAMVGARIGDIERKIRSAVHTKEELRGEKERRNSDGRRHDHGGR